MPCFCLLALDFVHVLCAVPSGSLIPYFPPVHRIPALSHNRDHSLLLKPPELPAWQCCQLSLVPAGGNCPVPETTTPECSSDVRYPCVYWLEIWGNLFHEGGSSNSSLYCKDLSVGKEAVVRAWSVPAIFRYYLLCKFLVLFWFPERRSGWLLEDLLVPPLPCPVCQAPSPSEIRWELPK